MRRLILLVLFLCACRPTPPPSVPSAVVAINDTTASQTAPVQPRLALPEMVVQRSHADGISMVRFLANDNGFVDCSRDGTVHLRRFDGHLVRVIRPGPAQLNTMALAPSGDAVLTEGDGVAQLWSLRDGKLLRRFADSDKVLGISPNGEWVATANKDVVLWRITGERVHRHLGHKGAIKAGTFSPDSSILATGDAAGWIFMWEAKRGAPIQIWRAGGEVMALAFSPQDKALAVATRQGPGRGQLRLYTLDGKVLRTLAEGEFTDVRYDREGQMVAAGGGAVTVWDAKGQLLRKFEPDLAQAPGSAPTSVDLYDGRVVAASADRPHLRMWILPLDGMLSVDLPDHTTPVAAVAYAPDGSMAVSGRDGSIDLWSTTGRLLSTIDAGKQTVRALAFSPDGKHLASSQHGLHLYSRTGVLERSMGAGAETIGAVFSTDGKWLACGRTNGAIEVWNSETGQLARSFRAHNRSVTALATSPDGTLVSGSADGEMAVWSWTGQLGRRLGGAAAIQAVAVSPAGDLLASADSSFIRLYTRTGELVRQLPSPAAQSLAFSRDGRLLAAPAGEQVALWTLNDFQSRLLAEHGSRVQAIAFDPTGPRVAGASQDASARLWNTNSGDSMILLARNGEWLTASPDGLFDSSPGAGTFIMMARDLKAWPIDQFAPYNNRPDVLLARLGLGTPELLAHYHRQHVRRVRRLGLANGTDVPQHVPTAKIVEARLTDRKLRVRLQCQDDRVDLARHDFYVNDVPVSRGPRLSGRQAIVDETFELGTGENKVEASCTNVQGAESYRLLTQMPYDKPVQGDLYYLGLGASQYRNPELDLQFADADATELGQRLAKLGGFRRVHVKTLTNAEVTVAGLRAAGQWLAQARVDDIVVLFAAGHGLHDRDADETYYFLTHEADVKDLAGTAAPFELLEEILMATPARRRLVLLDTCESGELDGEESARVALPGTVMSRGLRRTTGVARAPYVYERDRYIYNSLLRRSGAIVLSSSRGGQASYESAQLRHGFFTAAILQALSDRAADTDGDGQLSTKELGRYVSGRVIELTQGLQQPTIDRDNVSVRLALPIGP
jgi:WD40 repeat protein